MLGRKGSWLLLLIEGLHLGEGLNVADNKLHESPLFASSAYMAQVDYKYIS
jgi:hypothetical protein